MCINYFNSPSCKSWNRFTSTLNTSKRHKKEKHQRDRKYESSDGSSHASLSSSKLSRIVRGRHHSKKKNRKETKKKHKKKKNKKHESKKKSHRHDSLSWSPSSSSPATVTTIAAPPGAHELASALTQLFDSYPAIPRWRWNSSPFHSAEWWYRIQFVTDARKKSRSITGSCVWSNEYTWDGDWRKWGLEMG